MSAFNLPPGVSVNDIPGNKPQKKKPSEVSIRRAIRYLTDDKYDTKWADYDIAKRNQLRLDAIAFLQSP